MLDRGILKFLLEKCIFTYDAKPYTEDIYSSTNLADFKAKSQNMCHWSASRDAAYTLLVTVVKLDDQSLEHVINNYWSDLLNRVENPKESGICKPPESRFMMEKFIGIRNLGAICYMISMI